MAFHSMSNYFYWFVVTSVFAYICFDVYLCVCLYVCLIYRVLAHFLSQRNLTNSFHYMAANTLHGAATTLHFSR